MVKAGVSCKLMLHLRMMLASEPIVNLTTPGAEQSRVLGGAI